MGCVYLARMGEGLCPCSGCGPPCLLAVTLSPRVSQPSGQGFPGTLAAGAPPVCIGGLTWDRNEAPAGVLPRRRICSQVDCVLPDLTRVLLQSLQEIPVPSHPQHAQLTGHWKRNKPAYPLISREFGGRALACGPRTLPQQPVNPPPSLERSCTMHPFSARAQRLQLRKDHGTFSFPTGLPAFWFLLNARPRREPLGPGAPCLPKLHSFQFCVPGPSSSTFLENTVFHLVFLLRSDSSFHHPPAPQKTILSPGFRERQKYGR